MTPAHSYATSRRGGGPADARRPDRPGQLALRRARAARRVLHVSDGLPLNPGEELFQFLLELCGGQRHLGVRARPRTIENPSGGSSWPGSGTWTPPRSTTRAPSAPRPTRRPRRRMLDAQRYSVAKNLQTLAAHANAHRVTLYTLQASGLQATEAADASYGPDDRLFQFPSIGTVPARQPPGLAAAPGRRTPAAGRSSTPTTSCPTSAACGRTSRASTRSASPRAHAERRPRAPARGAGQAAGGPPALPPELPRQAGDGEGGGPHPRRPLLRHRGQPAGHHDRGRRAASPRPSQYAVPVRLRIPLFKLAILNQRDDVLSRGSCASWWRRATRRGAPPPCARSRCRSTSPARRC